MKEMKSSRVSVKLIDGTVVSGLVNMGASRRLSDFFNKYESAFLVLFDVTIGVQVHEVLFVNCRHILWAKPVDEASAALPGKGESALKQAADDACNT